MNTNTPSSPPTVKEFYGHDHARLDILLQQFERCNASDPVKAASLFDQFKSGLERHILWEEEILFPIFEDKTGLRGVGPTAVMRFEHSQIKDLLARIQSALARPAPASPTDLFALKDLLVQHNHKEENILYPGMDSMLDANECARVFAEMEKYPDAPSDPMRA